MLKTAHSEKNHKKQPEKNNTLGTEEGKGQIWLTLETVEGGSKRTSLQSWKKVNLEFYTQQIHTSRMKTKQRYFETQQN